MMDAGPVVGEVKTGGELKESKAEGLQTEDSRLPSCARQKAPLAASLCCQDHDVVR
jgi:hypothetical protein